LSLFFGLWTVGVFYIDAMPKTALNIIPLLATPISALGGTAIGAIGWITQRKTDGNRCIVGALACLAVLVGSSFAVGRVISGYR
jgi:hypothetical protein